MRAFAFMPSQIIVSAGNDVRLHFVGAQGPKHTIEVTGQGVEQEFILTRGRIKTVEFGAVEAGTIDIECYDHGPNRHALVTVTP